MALLNVVLIAMYTDTVILSVYQ